MAFVSVVHDESTSDTDVWTLSAVVFAAITDGLLAVSITSEDGTFGDLAINSVIIDPAGLNIALTEAVEKRTSSGSFRNSAAVWYLLDADWPAAGTYDIQITFNGTVTEYGATALIHDDMEQEAPEATGTGAGGGSTTVSASITTLTDNALLVDACSGGEGAVSISPDSPQVSRDVSDVDSHWHGMSEKVVATAGATSMDWTAPSTQNRFELAVAAFAPKAAAGGVDWGAMTAAKRSQNNVNLRR